MKRSNARRMMAVALIGAVGLAACGGDDETTDDSTAASAPADTATEAPVPATDAAAPATDAAPATEYVDEEYDIPSTEAPADTTVAETAPATDAPDAPDDEVALTISEFVFSSPTVTAATPFSLLNADGFAHTVTSRDDFFDVGLDGGGSDTLTIEKAGTYEIFCRIHPSMEGVITVV